MSDPIGGIGKAIGNSIGRTGLDTGSKQIPVMQDKGGTSGASFSDTLKQMVNRTSDQQDMAADYAARFTRGEPVELHQVMATAEEASLSLEMLVEVRNKFLDAYRTVINMQS
ncbi:MAG: flagellar hook-basal body complex protein FliE [Gemmatimonadaceae bacterium]